MSVKVLYFASFRELVGKAEESFFLDNSTITAEVLWSTLNAGIELPASALVAINQEYANLNAPISDADEIAFFPPVTGG